MEQQHGALLGDDVRRDGDGDVAHDHLRRSSPQRHHTPPHDMYPPRCSWCDSAKPQATSRARAAGAAVRTTCHQRLREGLLQRALGFLVRDGLRVRQQRAEVAQPDHPGVLDHPAAPAQQRPRPRPRQRQRHQHRVHHGQRRGSWAGQRASTGGAAQAADIPLRNESPPRDDSPSHSESGGGRGRRAGTGGGERGWRADPMTRSTKPSVPGERLPLGSRSSRVTQ